MAGPNTLNGNYGMMPIDLLLRKQEVSCVPEPGGREQLHAYNRQSLKEVGPVAPLFESEQKRVGRESGGSLALRYGGKRRATEPWLEDGLFLDFEGVHKDPRSLMDHPDMMKHRDQQMARARFIKKYPDADNSIPEHGVTPYMMVQRLKHTQHEVADRLKIFSTAKTGFHTGSGLQRPTTTSSKGKVFMTQRGAKLADFTLQNRRNKTTTLSNNTVVGWRRGVDHEFKVSQYGKKNTGLVPDSAGWNKNRKNTRAGHQVFRQIEGAPVPLATAIAIVNLAKLRRGRQAAGKDAEFGTAWAQKTKTQRKIADDLVKTLYNAQQSRTSDAHADIYGEVSVRHARSYVVDQKMPKIVINPTIAEKMASSNKQMKPKERDALRQEILQSAEDEGIYVEDRARHRHAQPGDAVKAKHNVLYDYEPGDERKVAQYSRAAAPTGAARMENMDFEAYGGESSTQTQRSMVHEYASQQVGGTEGEIAYGKSAVRSKTIGGLGTKYVRNYHTDHVNLEMNDF